LYETALAALRSILRMAINFFDGVFFISFQLSIQLFFRMHSQTNLMQSTKRVGDHCRRLEIQKSNIGYLRRRTLCILNSDPRNQGVDEPTEKDDAERLHTKGRSTYNTLVI
jgi:hypothetical protein